MEWEYLPVQKPKHKRRKKTAKERGRITPEVYADALDRSGGYCERCGSPQWLECAHLMRRWKLPETTINDVAMLCGPQTATGTCHNWIDHTVKGREWALELREQFWHQEIHNDSGKFRELPKMSKGHQEVDGVIEDG